MAPSLLKVMWFLLLIGPLITVHELGHFLVAKLFRVKVLRFSIGFGPRLLGFRKGETDYQIAALPLGGYVKMAGDDPTEAPRPEDRGRGFLEQAPWKRSLIALAGPVMNLVIPVLIYFCVFYFQTTAISSRVGTVDRDSPAYAAGLRDGDRIVAIDGEKVQYFEQLSRLISPKLNQKLTLEVERPDGSHFTTTASPKTVMEPGILHDEPRAILGIKPRQPAPVVAVAGPDTPAGKAGLHSLDRITKVAGTPVKLFSDLQHALSQQHGPFEVEFLRAEPLPTPGAAASTMVLHHATIAPVPGQDLGISEPETVVATVDPKSPAALAGLKRGDQLLAANGTPLLGWSTLERIRLEAKLSPIDLELRRDGKLMHLQVTQRNMVQQNERGKDQTVLYFGAQPDDTDEPGEMIPIHRGVVESTVQAARIVPTVIGEVAEAFVGLVTTQVSPKTLGGPVMLFDIASKSAALGWDYFLGLMAGLSVNLGILNLVPIPILDGFHVLSAGFEWVRRRPLSLRAREIANVVGLAMLLIMMAYVLRNDIMNYVLK